MSTPLDIYLYEPLKSVIFAQNPYYAPAWAVCVCLLSAAEMTAPGGKETEKVQKYF